MLSIKDYINLKNIYEYIESEREREIRENNGYSNKPVNELSKMQENLGEILYKLETED